VNRSFLQDLLQTWLSPFIDFGKYIVIDLKHWLSDDSRKDDRGQLVALTQNREICKSLQ
jgi:hypothetical protein